MGHKRSRKDNSLPQNALNLIKERIHSERNKHEKISITYISNLKKL